MLELTIVRHAEAMPDSNDYTRPLTAAGLQQISITAQQLQQLGIKPMQIIASPALRTLTTAQKLANYLTIPAEQVITHAQLYNCHINDWLSILRTLPNHLKQILVVGHNPAISSLPAFLTDTEINYLAPANFRHLALMLSNWADLDQGTATQIKD